MLHLNACFQKKEQRNLDSLCQAHPWSDTAEVKQGISAAAPDREVGKNMHLGGVTILPLYLL